LNSRELEQISGVHHDSINIFSTVTYESTISSDCSNAAWDHRLNMWIAKWKGMKGP